MNAAQQKRLDELLEKEFPTHQFIEKETATRLSVECTCGWKAFSRKSNAEHRRIRIRVARNRHLDEKH